MEDFSQYVSLTFQNLELPPPFGLFSVNAHSHTGA